MGNTFAVFRTQQTVPPQPEHDKIDYDNAFELPGCPICLQIMNRGISALPCGHCYHFDCISKHLAQENFCPMCKNTVTADQITLLYYLVVDKVKIVKGMIEPNALIQFFGGQEKVSQDQKECLRILEKSFNALKKQIHLQDENVQYHIAQSEKYEWELARIHRIVFRNEQTMSDLRSRVEQYSADLKRANQQKSTALQNMGQINDDLLRKIKIEGELRLEVSELRKSVFRLSAQINKLKADLNLEKQKGRKIVCPNEVNEKMNQNFPCNSKRQYQGKVLQGKYFQNNEIQVCKTAKDIGLKIKIPQIGYLDDTRDCQGRDPLSQPY